jgi:4-hydroxy-3-methylbut-2-en-1-yl diphosphate reductase
MKFSTSSVVAIAALAGSAAAFAPSAQSLNRITSSLSMSTEVAEESKKRVTKKEKRLQFMKTESFHRRGFKDVREGVEKSMEEQFKSQLVDELTSNDFVLEREGVKVFLAKDFGFCWGVERSIALAYEAVEHFPGKTVHITNELIHNPEVND